MISGFPTSEFESSRLIPKVWEFYYWGSFTDFDETEEKLEENGDDID